MSTKTIQPVSCLKGEALIPGDKSISHRALILSSIAEGNSTITGLSRAIDVQSTLNCIKDLGINVKVENSQTLVEGKGLYGYTKPDKILNAGNSGTTMRLLTGILSAMDFDCTIDGDESLRNRPMRRIIDPLEKMGANIDSNNYKAPLSIRGGAVKAIDYASSIASAQLKSCIILAGLYAKGITRVTEPAKSRDHTERMLTVFGVQASYSIGGAAVRGPATLKATTLDIPRDISASAFFLIAACLVQDSRIVVKNVGINESRAGFLDALASMGARVYKTNQTEINQEPRAELTSSSTKLRSTNLSGSIISNIIDEIPVLAVAATQAHGITTIRDAEELRVKETDRIQATVTNLKKMGADIRETKDGMVIKGPTPLKGTRLDSFGDHRIAMASAIAALIAEGETTLTNTDCIDISFPGFFDVLEGLICD
ncbi:3-phosphoshikimate 1-carboxyvinyltransferase [candidate division KSB1 bacterium]|jgi:3-phosphoshikimate 1-carboxyvinyltransferase|nr:3-phosphoshikimate 1-carboxyvinyltransferase [candidate division KSB1 bacterium]